MNGLGMPTDRRDIDVPQTDVHDIGVTVNGMEYRRGVEARMLLSDFLRHDLLLAGTHVGCEHGVCGACTVLFDGVPVRSCLMFAAQADRHEIMTVEGLAPDPETSTRCKRLCMSATASSAAIVRPAFS